MQYEVQLTRAVAQTTAVVRFRAGLAELPKVIPAACGEVWSFIRASGSLHGGRLLAVYGDGDRDAGWDIECGAEVDRPFTGTQRVVCSATPAGPAAVAVHWGPYHRLGEAHEAVRKWCADNGHIRAGLAWEVYGHWNDDPSKLRTDVYYLLRSAKA
jgi:effector-binding domain-containing protein